MTDYIKREDAIEIVTSYKNSEATYIKDWENIDVADMLIDIAVDLENINAADVVEVDKVNKIYEKLADLLGIPCNYSPCDEIMLESERCKDDCGYISEAECWRRYFDVVCDGERKEA